MALNQYHSLNRKTSNLLQSKNNIIKDSSFVAGKFYLDSLRSLNSELELDIFQKPEKKDKSKQNDINEEHKLINPRDLFELKSSVNNSNIKSKSTEEKYFKKKKGFSFG